jgi:hypothetical protein
MKKLIFLFLAIPVFIACNNSSAKSSEGNATIDSLEKEIDDGHIIGMGKMGALIKAQNEAKRLLDSVATLPAKAQEAAAPYTAKVEDVLKDLGQADLLMNKWMEEYNIDSAMNNAEARIKYLVSETGKIREMNKAILGSLAKADSVLRKKF